MRLDVRPETHYEIECWRDGTLLWVERFHNLVTSWGRDLLLDALFVSGHALPVWYVGLVKADGFTAYSATDTSASHAGWVESPDYGQPTRPVCTFGTPAGGSVSNALAKAVFTMNAITQIRGAFLIDNSVIEGVTGVLYGVGDFSVVRNVIMGDTINVTVTLSA
jgi:hypothetical protein